MIFTIGKWTKESLAIRQELADFMLGEFVRKEPQIGSILHTQKCSVHPRLWEYATAITNANPEKKEILDAGGLNNLLGWFLHKKYDCTIMQTGLNAQDEQNFKKNCKPGTLNINGLCLDMRRSTYVDKFDIVYSINVIEHVREIARKEEKRKHWKYGKTYYWNDKWPESQYEKEEENKFVKALAMALKPGGLLVITYDLFTRGVWRRQPRCAYMRSFDDIMERIVEPSELTLVGEIDEVEYPPKLIDPRCSTGIVIMRK